MARCDECGQDADLYFITGQKASVEKIAIVCKNEECWLYAKLLARRERRFLQMNVSKKAMNMAVDDLLKAQYDYLEQKINYLCRESDE